MQDLGALASTVMHECWLSLGHVPRKVAHMGSNCWSLMNLMTVTAVSSKRSEIHWLLAIIVQKGLKNNYIYAFQQTPELNR